LDLPITEFYMYNGKLKTPCKKCRNERNRISNKKWRQTEQGKLKLKLSKKKYKQKVSEQNKIKRQEKKLERENRQNELIMLKNLEKQKKIDLKLKNKEEERQKKIQYYNSEEYKELKKQRRRKIDKVKWKKRWDTDERFAMKVRLRNLIRNSFRKRGYSKTSKTQEILGVDYGGLIEYIQSKFQDGMSWDNRGLWHIDHIIPLSSAKTKDELINLCHYTNLQPLWAEDNIKKSDELTPLGILKEHLPYSEVLQIKK